jgi:hypothetical protein
MTKRILTVMDSNNGQQQNEPLLQIKNCYYTGERQILCQTKPCLKTSKSNQMHLFQAIFRNTRENHPTCRKSLTHFITYIVFKVVSITPCHARIVNIVTIDREVMYILFYQNVKW